MIKTSDRHAVDPTTSDCGVVAATFESREAGSQALSAVTRGFPDQVGGAALLLVASDGTPRIVDLWDWEGGREALMGGLAGIIGAPQVMSSASNSNALAVRLGDTGFDTTRFRALGAGLRPEEAAVILKVADSAVPVVERLLGIYRAKVVVTDDLASGIGTLFTNEPPAWRNSKRAA